MYRDFLKVYIAGDGYGVYLKLGFHTVFVINLTLREMVEIFQEADFIHL